MYVNARGMCQQIKGLKVKRKTLCVNVRGMCHRLGEPKNKTSTYCMNLKQRIERWNKKIVQNRVRM
jgi:hypothetical protein